MRKKLINAIHVKALQKDFLIYLKCILHSHRKEEGFYVYSLNVGQKNYLILCVRSLPLLNSMHTLTPHYLGMFRFMTKFAWSFTQSIRDIPRLQCLTQLGPLIWECLHPVSFIVHVKTRTNFCSVF